MTLEFRQTNQWILGLWFVRERDNLPVHERQDWLCMVWKDADSDAPTLPWRIKYRVCRHVSEGLRMHGAPADERSWYEGQADAALTAAAMLEKMEGLAGQIAASQGVPVASVHVQGNSDKALRLLQAQPWFHISVEPAPCVTSR